MATTVGEYNPFRYKGYHFDSDTGMYYCHTRYYVPDWCRWLCEDSIGLLNPSELFEQNLYCYCNNNPVCYIDPSGHIAVFLIGLLVGAIVGAGIGFGVTAYRDYKDDGEVFNDSIPWYEYAVATVVGGVVGGGIGAGIGYLLPAGASVAFGGGLSVSTGGAMALSSGFSVSGIGVATGLMELASALGAITLFAEHTKNKRPSSRGKHEKGQAQRKREQRGGEKGDARRPYRKWKRGMSMILLLMCLFNDSL